MKTWLQVLFFQTNINLFPELNLYIVSVQFSCDTYVIYVLRTQKKTTRKLED